MNKAVQLSIIVPVHNTSAYLKTCLDSLAIQPLEDYEIIVVDDCSDQPVKLPCETNCKYRISLVRLDAHGGPGGARNKGLALAQGRYVAFCDSDDWVDATYYADAVKFSDIHQADIAMCSLIRNYDTPTKQEIYKCQYNSLVSITGDIALQVLTKQYDLGFIIIPSSTNKIYRKEFLDRHNLRFAENVMFEDLLFSFIATLEAEKIITIPDVRYHHYRRKNSITQSISMQHIDDYIQVFTNIRLYLQRKNCYDKYRDNFYKYAEQFYNLIIREIFQFEHSENGRKRLISYSFEQLKSLFDFSEYMEYCSAEKLRQHIQPMIDDTTIY